ncbi:hydrogenase/urease maturation nickel metallochaperone HypA [Candidatus Pacearchaeota archaeon]|nr:hydrogenase/urease maturation nickel metallochaperone HypA [Candidatus Pacearchaeota archaeon]
MHEHSFIQAIIRDIRNKENVISVLIEVGELAGIEAEHLKEHLIDETSWIVNVKLKKSKIKCSCGYIGEAKIKQRMHDFVVFECPVCGLVPEIIEGKDIKIKKIVYK